MWRTPPLAFLRMMETGVFDHRPTWSCWPPCLIPAGLIRGTREKADGTNLNRDCKDPRTCKITSHVNGIEVQQSFNKTFCLHYDWESPGFYLYELDPGEFPILAYTMVAAASAHCPIETATMIDGREIHDRHHSSNVRPLMR